MVSDFTCDCPPAKASIQRRHFDQTPSVSSSSSQHPHTMSSALGLGGYSSSEDEDETVAPISKSNQVIIASLETPAQKGRMSC
jgi:hypothetical protein